MPAWFVIVYVLDAYDDGSVDNDSFIVDADLVLKTFDSSSDSCSVGNVPVSDDVISFTINPYA